MQTHQKNLGLTRKKTGKKSKIDAKIAENLSLIPTSKYLVVHL